MLAAVRALLLACLALGSCRREPTAPAEPAEVELPGSWIRFVEDGEAAGRLLTGWTTLRDAAGHEVALAAVVHIADRDYYDALEERFRAADAVLYEMIKPANAAPASGDGGGGLVSTFQRLLCRGLDLTFQLDEVDYGAPNFVHADLTTDEFRRRWRERGESVLALFLRVLAGSGGRPSELTPAALAAAVRSSDRHARMKLLLGKEFGNLEASLGGLAQPDAEGRDRSMLIGERNAAALEVLQRELRAGRRRLVLFYGAAHMPDFAARLVTDHGFRPVRQEWIPAWRITPAGG